MFGIGIVNTCLFHVFGDFTCCFGSIAVLLEHGFTTSLMAFTTSLLAIPSGDLTSLWKITIVNGKFHYFYGHSHFILSSYVNLPEGTHPHFQPWMSPKNFPRPLRCLWDEELPQLGGVFQVRSSSALTLATRRVRPKVGRDPRRGQVLGEHDAKGGQDGP